MFQKGVGQARGNAREMNSDATGQAGSFSLGMGTTPPIYCMVLWDFARFYKETGALTELTELTLMKYFLHINARVVS